MRSALLPHRRAVRRRTVSLPKGGLSILGAAAWVHSSFAVKQQISLELVSRFTDRNRNACITTLDPRSVPNFGSSVGGWQ
jgi:hypothetical protein